MAIPSLFYRRIHRPPNRNHGPRRRLSYEL